MYLKKLTLTNFKNYEQGSLSLSPGINCFIGNNGVGKTNILDAVHYLSLTRSFFNSVEALSIRHDEDYFIIEGVFSNDDDELGIICSYQRQKQKSFKCNGKEYEKFSDHIGRFPAVMVSPADNMLITGSSEERRRFLNMIISQYDHEYLNALVNYNRSLKGRNRLLKEYSTSPGFDEELLATYDHQLEKYGSVIHKARLLLIEKMVPVFNDYYSTISLSREEVALRYKSQLSGESMGDLLVSSRERDRFLQYTTCGVHKDDLEFITGDGFPVRQIGSQGQQKSYLVALKLAKFGYIAERSGIRPMLLLDDLFDKFDADRVKQLIRMLESRNFGQVFITDTDKSRLKHILAGSGIDYKLFSIGEKGVEEVIHNGEADEKK